VSLPNPGRLVAVAGDWHGNDVWARNVIRSVAKLGVTTVLQLGDFGIWPGDDGTAYLDAVVAACQQYEVTVMFLDGNHEDFTQLEAAPRDSNGIAHVREHVWHLPRALRWRWNGIGFAALGGATSLDARFRKSYVDWWPQEALRPEQHQRLVDGGSVDVLLTHDSPSGISIPGLSDQWPPAALDHARQHRRALRDTVDKVQPTHLLHGHFHVAYRDELTLSPSLSTVVVGLDSDGSSYDGNAILLDLWELAADIDQRRQGQAGTFRHGLLQPSLSAEMDRWSAEQKG